MFAVNAIYNVYIPYSFYHIFVADKNLNAQNGCEKEMGDIYLLNLAGKLINMNYVAEVRERDFRIS